MDNIWLLWDLIAAAIIICCCYMGARHGFIRTVVSFFSYFVALAAAKLLSPKCAEFVYDGFVREALVSAVHKKVEEGLASSADSAVQIFGAIPKLFQGLFPDDTALGSISSASLNSQELVESVVESVLRGPAIALLHSLCFMVIFSLTIFLIRHVSRMFSQIYRIPVIGPINTLLGGIAGLLESVLYMLIGAFIFGVVIMLSGDKLEWLNSEIIDNTFIWRVFYKIIGT